MGSAGDFSFAYSLLQHHAFTSLVATSLDSRDVVLEKYPHALKNLRGLEDWGTGGRDREGGGCGRLNGGEEGEEQIGSEGGEMRKNGDGEVEEGEEDDDEEEQDDEVEDDDEGEKSKEIKKDVRFKFGVDATKMTRAKVMGRTKMKKRRKKGGSAERGFDKIVFNFPHVGGKSTDVNRQVRYNQGNDHIFYFSVLQSSLLSLLFYFLSTHNSTSKILYHCLPCSPLPTSPSLCNLCTRTITLTPHFPMLSHNVFYNANKASSIHLINHPSLSFSKNPNFKKSSTDLLVSFLTTSLPLLAPDGVILITLFDGLPYSLWNIRDLARHVGLRVGRSFRFDANAYPGYRHARTGRVVKAGRREIERKEWRNGGDGGEDEDKDEDGGGLGEGEEEHDQEGGESGGENDKVEGDDGQKREEQEEDKRRGWKGEERPARTYIFEIAEDQNKEGLVKQNQKQNLKKKKNQKKGKGKRKRGGSDDDDDDHD